MLHVLDRLDLIFLKFYAYANSQGAPKHYQDLLAMAPTTEELDGALTWTLGQHELAGFQQDLRAALTQLGAHDVVKRLE